MAIFRFTLATLLRLREAARDEKRAKLAEAYRAEEVVRARLGELQDEIQSLKERYTRGVLPGPVNVDHLVDSQRYEFIIKAEYGTVHGQLNSLQAEIEKRRDALIASDRDVRVLEKLRETQHERHIATEQLAEIKLLDEIATRRFQQEAH
jgi:flagellar export protein FliJ